MFACQICRLDCESQAALIRHAKLIHILDHRFICHECSFDSATEAEMLAHQEAVHFPFPCAECGLRAQKKTILNQHITAVHLQQHPLKCPHEDCFFQSFDLLQMQMHEESHRENEARSSSQKSQTDFVSEELSEAHVSPGLKLPVFKFKLEDQKPAESSTPLYDVEADLRQKQSKRESTEFMTTCFPGLVSIIDQIKEKRRENICDYSRAKELIEESANSLMESLVKRQRELLDDVEDAGNYQMQMLVFDHATSLVLQESLGSKIRITEQFIQKNQNNSSVHQDLEETLRRELEEAEALKNRSLKMDFQEECLASLSQQLENFGMLDLHQ